MIAPDGHTPILMDLGSLSPSPTKITSRSHALQVQDTAAEQSTLPYRAPELFDVRVGATIDTKSDIWSIGCTVYACLIGKSPFERRSEETGGSLTMCVLGGDWRFPDEGRGGGPGSSKAAGKRRESGAGRTGEPEPGEDMKLHEGVKDVVRRCLKVEPAERPDVDELMEVVEAVIRGLPDEDGDEADAGVAGSSGAAAAYADAPHGEA